MESTASTSDSASTITTGLSEVNINQQSPPIILKEGEIFDPLKNLNEKQLEAFKEIKSNFSDLTDPTDIAFCTDMCFLRYLRARNYIVSKSEKMLRDTLEWRKKFRPQDIQLGGDIREIGSAGCVYVNKRDKKGRPIIFAVPRNDTLKNVPSELKFKNLVYWLEQGFSRMDDSKGIEQFCFIVDYKDFGSGNMDMKTNLEAMHFLLDHCPERMGQSLFLDPPALFWFAWKIISPFLNEVTLSKVRFINSKKVDGKRTFAELLEYVDIENLEQNLGGNLDYNYNIDEYLKENPDPIVDTPPITFSTETDSKKQKKEKKKEDKEKRKEEKEKKKEEKEEKKKEKEEKKKLKKEASFTKQQENADEVD
ncbi:hypothetical protein ACTFIZ_008306 [Dictyostelium cf. discoideum]